MTNCIGITILFFNKIKETIECINSFLPSGQRIYILNNGSSDNQWNILLKTYKDYPQIHLFNSEKNLGVSAGRNFLIKQVHEPWLFSVDNDIRISPTHNWLLLFRDYIQANPSAKIITPSIYNVHEKQWSQPLNIKNENKNITISQGDFELTNCFPGGASIIHRSIFEKYGVYDENMFVGFEDYEFAMRALFFIKSELEVHHIKCIQLFHEHKVQKINADKVAVMQRYNSEKHIESFNHLVEKYNIKFDHDWEWWTKKQIEEMTTNKLWERVKHKLKSIIIK